MKATKKLMIASVALVAAASLTVGVTFAWFSHQSNVGLGSVQFGVGSGDENLMVAVTKVGEAPQDGSFAYSLSADAIKAKINAGSAITYQPLTVDSATDEISATDTITLKKQEGSGAGSGDYAEFDLVFRYTPVTASGSMPNLILNSGSVLTADPAEDASYTPAIPVWWGSDGAEANKTKYGPELNPGDSIKARARDAARVAFVYGDTTKSNKIWAPSEYFDSGSVTTSDSPKGYYLDNLAKDYATYLGAEQNSYVTPTYASRVYAAQEGDQTFANSAIAQFPSDLQGKTYSELRITVKVWLEGKDGDCLPSIVGDQFAFLLKFRTSTV